MNNIEIMMIAGHRRFDLDKVKDDELEKACKRMEMIIHECSNTIKLLVAEMEKRGYSPEKIFKVTTLTDETH